MTKPMSEEDMITRINYIGSMSGYSFVRWVGCFSGYKSRCVVSCNTDSYEWEASWSGILGRRTTCKKCRNVGWQTEDHIIKQINEAGSFKFIRFDGNFNKMQSRVVCRCDIDGYEWTTYAFAIIKNGSGCARCAGRNEKISPSQMSNKIDNMGDVRFVKWLEPYKGNRTRAAVLCTKCGHTRESYTHNILAGYGCPSCSKSGFDVNKTASVYVYKWTHPDTNDSFFKCGVTNQSVDDRIKMQVRNTEYKPQKIITIDGIMGSDALRIEKKVMGNFAGRNVDKSKFLDGYTETFTVNGDQEMDKLMEIFNEK